MKPVQSLLQAAVKISSAKTLTESLYLHFYKSSIIALMGNCIKCLNNVRIDKSSHRP